MGAPPAEPARHKVCPFRVRGERKRIGLQSLPELNFKGRHYPFLVYLGFKWDPEDAARRALARYTCYPSFTLKDIVEKVSLAFSGPDAGEAVEITKGIVDAASRVAPGILYVDVTEDGNPRRSFDINMYDAALTLGAIRPLLMRMADHYRLPPEQCRTFIETIKTRGWATCREASTGRDAIFLPSISAWRTVDSE